MARACTSRKRSIVQSLVVLIAFTLVIALPDPASADDEEIRLVQKLFVEQPYSSLIRPCRNHTDTVVVEIAMELVQIIDVDERNQEMKTNVWLTMTWNDHQLVWDAEDYSGINVIRLLPYRVWRPDLVLLNNADANYEVSYPSNVLIQNIGQVTWVPPTIYRSSCTINVEYFPFDEQVCEIRLGSWTYEKQEVNYKWKSSCVVWFNSFWESGVWYVMDARGVISDDTHNPPRSYVSYKIILRRRILFYTINLIIPVALISLLTLTVFYIPVVEGEKVTTGVCTTVSLAVFMTLLTKLLPSTSLSVSLLSKYLLFTFMTNMSAIFVTVVIINWNYRTPRTHRMPRWARTLFLILLPKVLRMKPLDHIVEIPTSLSNGDTNGNGTFDTTACTKTSNKRKSKKNRDPKLVSARVLDGWTSPVFSDNESNCVDFVYTPSSNVLRPKMLFSAQCSEEEDDQNHRDGFDRDSIGLNHLRSRERSDEEAVWKKSTPTPTTTPTPVRSNSMRGNGSKKTICFDEPLEEEQIALLRNLSGLQITSRYLKTLTRVTIDSINFMIQHLDADTEYSKVLDEWKYAADVIDRVQLFFFLFVTIAGTLYFMVTTPYLFEDVDQLHIIEKLKNESAFECV